MFIVLCIATVLSATLACGALPTARQPEAWDHVVVPPTGPAFDDVVAAYAAAAEAPSPLPLTGDHDVVRRSSDRSLSEQSALPSVSPQRLRFCCVVHEGLLSVTMFIATWANANKARYLARGLNVTAKVIGTTEDLPWATKAARAVVRETDECDVFFGTAASNIALVGAIVVSKIWMDSASSATLSDKQQYPFYNRLYLDSRQDGEVIAAMITGLGVTSVHTLCTDESYGRSAMDGFAARAAAPDARFTVASRQCVLATAGKAEITAVLRRIATQTHQSHWVYLAIGLPHFPLVYEALNDAGLNQTLTFFAARCIGVAYPGLVCITPAVNMSFAGRAIAARDSDPAFKAALLSDFVTKAGASSTAAAHLAYPELTSGVDGVELVIEAYRRFREANPAIGDATRHQAAVQAFMRANVSLPGSVFGPLSLDAKGDRFLQTLLVMNTLRNGSLVAVGSLLRKSLATTEFTQVGDVYLHTTGAAVGLPLPTNVPIEESSSSTSVVLWVVIGFAALLLILGGLVAVAFLLRTPGSARNVADAPTDEALPFAVVFTDIQASTTLWAQLPTLMGPALDAHNSIIRAEIRKHHGYEVKTIGDSFMVAFKSVVDATKFSIEMQESLRVYDWGTAEIDDLYARLTDTPPFSSGSRPWNGLRVRVGMSHGIGKVAFDEISKGYDYFGTVVNTAARVEGVAHGGQVLLAEPAHEALSEALSSAPDALAGHAFEDLGPQPLRGLSDPVGLHQWRPKAGPMVQRTYPPLRLDVENVVEDQTAVPVAFRVDDGDVSSPNDAATSVVAAVPVATLAKAALATGPRLPMAAFHRPPAPAPGPESKYVVTPRSAWSDDEPHRSGSNVANGKSPGAGPAKDPAPLPRSTSAISGGDDDPAAASLQQSYVELVALLRPAMAKKDQRAVFEKVAKAWRVQDPTTVKATRHLVQDRESKLALMLMGAMLKGKASAHHAMSV